MKRRGNFHIAIIGILLVVVLIGLIPKETIQSLLASRKGENLTLRNGLQEYTVFDGYKEVLGFEKITDFNDNWKFYWAGDRINPGLEISNAEQIGYDDKAWKEVTLPHDYSMEIGFTPTNTLVGSEAGFLPGGTGWYRKKFVVPAESAGKKTFIRFGGVYMNSTVWVNGIKIGTYPNGYTPFTYDITDQIKADGQTENVIAVKVEHNQPSSRFYSGSGIYRKVELITTNQIHLPEYGITISTPTLEEDLKNQNVKANINTEIKNDTQENKTVRIRQTLLYYKTKEKLQESIISDEIEILAGETKEIESIVPIQNPKLWSTEDPNLYYMRTEILVDGMVQDVYDSRFGLRYFDITNEEGFTLNGEYMKLHGVCMHHDQGALGAVSNYAAVRRQMKMMKEMGANAIRVTHNPASDELLQICDELGLLVIEEAFDTWYNGKREYDYGKTAFEKPSSSHPEGSEDVTWGEFDIKQMVKRGKNFPSIIMWSIGNEIQEIAPTGEITDKSIETAEKLIKWVKEEDQTRKVTMAMNHFTYYEKYHGYTRVADLLDVVGLNYSDGNYDRIHKDHPDWVLYGSETSSAIRSRGEYGHPKTEMAHSDAGYEHDRYQMSSYDNDRVRWGSTVQNSWRADRDRKFIVGQFVWTGFDYIGEPTPWNNSSAQADPNYPKSSYFGIVDTAGLPKDAYYMYQSQWTDEPMVHILPHWNWEDENLRNDVLVEEMIPVRVYSNAKKVELFVDGVSYGEKTFATKQTSDGREYQQESETSSNLYQEWRLPYEGENITVVAKDENGKAVAWDQIDKASEVAKLKLEADREIIHADGEDLSYITVEARDKDNNICPNAENEITFELEGNGSIVGVDNGNAATMETFKKAEDGSWKIKTFHGKAVVIVKSNKTAGNINIIAKSDGIEQASINIETKTPVINNVESYQKLEYKTIVGEKPDLAKELLVTYIDGSEEMATVTWKLEEEDYNKPGKVLIRGIVEDTKEEVTATLMVIEDEDLVSSSYISTIVQQVKIGDNLEIKIRNTNAVGQQIEGEGINWIIRSADGGEARIENNTLYAIAEGTIEIQAEVTSKGNIIKSNILTIKIGKESELKYIKATVFNYDQETFNEVTKSKENGTPGIYFSHGNGEPAWNHWTGSEKYPIKNIAKKELNENREIEFNYPDGGLFTLEELPGKEIYTNVEIPMLKDGSGYYNFDSSYADYNFPNGIGANNTKFEMSKEKKNYQGFASERPKVYQGFFPFNSIEGENIDYHFGMRVNTIFYMTKDGMLPSTNQEMKFEFSGDDDIWIYIDGKLVLDLGGIHDAISGEINFATGEIIYYKGLKKDNVPITGTEDLWKILGTEWRENEEKPHTLDIFYLERGKGESNCNILYNIPNKVQKSDVLVHHYKEGTTEKVAEDVLISGEAGEHFETKVSKKIPKNYRFTRVEGNREGYIGLERQEVIYYYKPVDAIIHENDLAKTAKEKIIREDEVIDYTLEYNGRIERYIGNATVTIVDHLPYEIIEEKSNLNGGTYNREAKTITWIEPIENINTYENSQSGEFHITKKFEVVYQEIDFSNPTILNKADGTLFIEDTNQNVPIEEVEDDTKIELKERISANKILSGQREGNFTIAGDILTYTIAINNDGVVPTEVIVKDTIPEGCRLVEGSIKIDNIVQNYNEQDLINGITIVIPPKATMNVSFDGKVEQGASEIRNTAVVDEVPTNEVKIPVLGFEKQVSIVRQTEETIPEGSVTSGDKIIYRILVHNLGEEAISNIEVKDQIPEGTTLHKINENGSLNGQNEIIWNILTVAPGKTESVSFEVIVDYDNKEKTITNVARVENKPTNITETPFVPTPIKLESSINKTGSEHITEIGEKIHYEILYEASIKDFVGKAEVRMIDYLPYPIDEANSELAGGKYDAEHKTITWEEPVEVIDTYKNGDKRIHIQKEILLKYQYGGEENLINNIENRVEGIIDLIQPSPTNPQEEIVVKTERKEDSHIINPQISAKVIVHHYIYDEEKGGETTTKIADDEEIFGSLGDSYTTTKSKSVREDYECVNETPEKYQGTMLKKETEVIYYYKLKEPQIESNIMKTASVAEEDGIMENEEVILTKEGGRINYEIRYNITIRDYKGKATVQIVDTLPFEIDLNQSDLAGGIYSPENKTITWKEEVEVDSFKQGDAYQKTIEKNLTLVYQNLDKTIDLVNISRGTLSIYYPEGHTSHAGEVRLTETKEDDATVKQNYLTQRLVEKIWEDNQDKKGKRPENVTILLMSDKANAEEPVNTVLLSEANAWKHTFNNLPKYTKDGNIINYSIVEKETNAGDLEYYNPPEIKIVGDTILVTNHYKAMESDLNTTIEKTATEKITSSKDKINYQINYHATIENYIGEARIKIVDYLPYEIDESVSDLDGGIYNKDARTITWEERIDHINTDKNGAYKRDISKNISVVYKNLDVTEKTIVNNVSGRVDLYEAEKTKTVEASDETKVEIPGKVIVKYVDKQTGKEIPYQGNAEQNYGYTISGLAGESYETEKKEIPGYLYVEDSGNTTGTFQEGEITVIYYYEHIQAGKITVKYLEEGTGKELADTIYINGNIGDTYETEEKQIPNYKFVRVEGEKSGTLGENPKEIIYYYQRIYGKVIMRFLEKDNTPEDIDNKVLAEEEVLEGPSGEKYVATRKVIKNYKAADPEPTNQKGIFQKDPIYVIYYYEKILSGKVRALYLDVNTEEEILRYNQETGAYETYREEMQGYCGEEYHTISKEIPYYTYIKEKEPNNANGLYEENDIEVRYYYKKQAFNIGVDKQLTNIVVNGEIQKIKDSKIHRVEVKGENIENTNITVEYTIKVSNNGEIEGSTDVVEKIPSHFKVLPGTSEEWKEEDNILKTTVLLQPNETKELKVVLEWERGSDHVGRLLNQVELSNLQNPPNYEETTILDNKSQAELMIGIRTGENRETITKLMGITVLAMAMVVIYIVKTEKEE